MQMTNMTESMPWYWNNTKLAGHASGDMSSTRRLQSRHSQERRVVLYVATIDPPRHALYKSEMKLLREAFPDILVSASSLQAMQSATRSKSLSPFDVSLIEQAICADAALFLSSAAPGTPSSTWSQNVERMRKARGSPTQSISFPKYQGS